MSSATSSGVPRLVPGTDVRRLPLSPAEAFVLSRVDGATRVAEIAEETGQPLEQVVQLLERLAALGALAFDEPQTQPRRSSLTPPPRASGARRFGPVVETSAGVDARHPAAALYDPAELEEAVDIEPARRRQILDLYYRLDQLNHYQLFGIDPSADKKALKAAYFELVNVLHPDRYFGKQLGSFKPKLERLFARLSASYDVLSKNASRAEYDAYLRAQSRTSAFDAAQTDSAAHEAALQDVMRRIQAEAGTATASSSHPPQASVAPHALDPAGDAGHAPPEPRPSTSVRPSASIRPSDPDSRRRALARKLGKTPPGEHGEREAPGAEAERSLQEPRAREEALRREWAAEELKRRYQERVNAARDRQVETYSQAAKLALARGDHVGAANALRIAASLSPHDRALAERLNEVSGKAKHDLAASYLEQAEYEERDERWLSAANSYTKALIGRPEARIYERVAHCLLSGDGDLRTAGEMAKKAVLLDASNARLRLTLARFYVKAGMRQSAEGELSRAATLAPTDDKVSDWVRRLKRELG